MKKQIKVLALCSSLLLAGCNVNDSTSSKNNQGIQSVKATDVYKETPETYIVVFTNRSGSEEYLNNVDKNGDFPIYTMDEDEEKLLDDKYSENYNYYVISNRIPGDNEKIYISKHVFFKGSAYKSVDEISKMFSYACLYGIPVNFLDDDSTQLIQLFVMSEWTPYTLSQGSGEITSQTINGATHFVYDMPLQFTTLNAEASLPLWGVSITYQGLEKSTKIDDSMYTYKQANLPTLLTRTNIKYEVWTVRKSTCEEAHLYAILPDGIYNSGDLCGFSVSFQTSCGHTPKNVTTNFILL